MRKKSHILLAKYIGKYIEFFCFTRYKIAFYVGSIYPDLVPSFLTKKHEIHTTIDDLEKMLDQLLKMDKKNDICYYFKLGELIHYVADYFTFPHNPEFGKGMISHMLYESKLKRELRRYIKLIGEQELYNKNEQYKTSIKKLNSTRRIIYYIKRMHKKYISMERHTLKKDCKYIVHVSFIVASAVINH